MSSRYKRLIIKIMISVTSIMRIKQDNIFYKKYSTEFIAPFMNLEDTDIKIKDLSQKYPNARKGVSEVWLNNNF